MAATAYPLLADQDPTGVRLEAVGRRDARSGPPLLAPVVPTKAVAAPLTGFAAGLLGLYAKVPGMRREGSSSRPRTASRIAKDVWLLAIGLASCSTTRHPDDPTDDSTRPAPSRRRRSDQARAASTAARAWIRAVSNTGDARRHPDR